MKTRFFPILLVAGVAVVWQGSGDWARAQDFDYPHADLRGNLVLQEGCEESPTVVSLDITSVSTTSGETANFPLMLNGLADWEVVPPLPDYLLGTYSVGSLLGSSPNFLYGTPKPAPTVEVGQLGQAYTLRVEVVPTTTRMAGLVLDQDGEPQEGALVEVSGTDDNTYRAQTHGGGAFEIQLIGMGDARRKAEADATVFVRAADAKDGCGESRTTVRLKAGVTERQNLVITAKGDLSGEVLDSEGAPVVGARISLSYSDGKHFETTASGTGFYELKDVPEGEATATAICPKTPVRQRQAVKIKCDQRGYQRAPFTLDCGCKVAGLVRRPNGEPVEGARVTLKPSDGQEKSVTTNGAGRYSFTDAPKGAARITATCPEGRPSRSLSVEVTCPIEGQQVPLTLDCPRPGDFHLVHTGTVVSDCTFCHTDIKARGEAFFSFPQGADEVELLVPYTVTFRMQGKSGPGGTIAISPGSFTLKAQVRWTVERVRKHGRKCLRAKLETVEEGKQALRLQTFNEEGDLVLDHTVSHPAIAVPGWQLGSGRISSCEDPSGQGLSLAYRLDRSLAPFCVAPETVAGLVTGESRITEEILITPMRPAAGGGELGK